MAKKRGFLTPYRHYNFTDKDPSIDFSRTAVEDSGMTYRKISEESGVSVTTLYNWYHGKTRRPQFATMAEILLTCGVKVVDLSVLRRRAKKY